MNDDFDPRTGRGVVDTADLKRRIAELAARTAHDVAGVIDRLASPARVRPGSLCGLLACSGSMAGDKLLQAKAGLKDMARTLARQRMQVGLVGFDSEARLESKVEPWSERFEAVLARLDVGGSTTLAAGLAEAHKALRVHPGRRVVLLATDGFPDDPQAALEAAESVRQEGIEIWTIGTTGADHAFLRRIA